MLAAKHAYGDAETSNWHLFIRNDRAACSVLRFLINVPCTDYSPHASLTVAPNVVRALKLASQHIVAGAAVLVQCKSCPWTLWRRYSSDTSMQPHTFLDCIGTLVKAVFVFLFFCTLAYRDNRTPGPAT